MSAILVPIIVIGGLGLVLGGLLGLANLYLKVEVDPRIEKLIAMLPGYNCGSCGFPGCSGLAEDIIEMEVPLTHVNHVVQMLKLKLMNF